MNELIIGEKYWCNFRTAFNYELKFNLVEVELLEVDNNNLLCKVSYNGIEAKVLKRILSKDRIEAIRLGFSAVLNWPLKEAFEEFNKYLSLNYLSKEEAEEFFNQGILMKEEQVRLLQSEIEEAKQFAF